MIRGVPPRRSVALRSVLIEEVLIGKVRVCDGRVLYENYTRTHSAPLLADTGVDWAPDQLASYRSLGTYLTQVERRAQELRQHAST